MDREVLFVIGYSDKSLFVGHDLDFLICFETEHSLAVHFSEFLQSERKLIRGHYFGPVHPGFGEHRHSSVPVDRAAAWSQGSGRYC